MPVCFQKLLGSLSNERLGKQLEKSHILGSEQAGFRTSCSNSVHIFALRDIIGGLCTYNERVLLCFLLIWKKLLILLMEVLDGKNVDTESERLAADHTLKYVSVFQKRFVEKFCDDIRVCCVRVRVLFVGVRSNCSK